VDLDSTATRQKGTTSHDAIPNQIIRAVGPRTPLRRSFADDQCLARGLAKFLESPDHKSQCQPSKVSRPKALIFESRAKFFIRSHQILWEIRIIVPSGFRQFAKVNRRLLIPTEVVNPANPIEKFSRTTKHGEPLIPPHSDSLSEVDLMLFRPNCRIRDASAKYSKIAHIICESCVELSPEPNSNTSISFNSTRIANKGQSIALFNPKLVESGKNLLCPLANAV
jgi:hypothetical protein